MIRRETASKGEGEREEAMSRRRMRWVTGVAARVMVGAIGLVATRVTGEPSTAQRAAVPAAQVVPLGLEDPSGYIPADNP